MELHQDTSLYALVHQDEMRAAAVIYHACMQRGDSPDTAWRLTRQILEEHKASPVDPIALTRLYHDGVKIRRLVTV